MSCSVKIGDTVWRIGDYGNIHGVIYKINAMALMDEGVKITCSVLGCSKEMHGEDPWWDEAKRNQSPYRERISPEEIMRDKDIQIPKEIVAKGPEALRLHLALIQPDVSPDWEFLDELFSN